MTAAISRNVCIEAVKKLIDTGMINLAYVNPSSGRNFLHEAAWVDNIEAAELLLGTGAFAGRMDEPLPDNEGGHTALHLAGLRASPEFCRLLVEKGAEAAVKQKTCRMQPQTAADAAEGMGKTDCANLLREMMVTMDTVKFGNRLRHRAKTTAAK